MKLFDKLISFSSSVIREPEFSSHKSRAREHLESLVVLEDREKKKPSRKKTLHTKQRYSWLKGNPFIINKCGTSASEAEHVLVRGKFSSEGELRNWKDQPEFFEDSHKYDSNGSETLQTDSSFCDQSNCSLDTASTAFLGDFPCDITSNVWSDNEDFGSRHCDTCEFCRNAELPKIRMSGEANKLSTVLYFSKLLRQSSQGRLSIKETINRSISCQTLVSPIESTEQLTEQNKITTYPFNGYIELAFL